MTYATALLCLSVDIERDLQELEAAGRAEDAMPENLPDYLRRCAKSVCLPAELDLIPTDNAANYSGTRPEPDQVLQKGKKPSVDLAMRFLLGDGQSHELILALFESLLSFDEVS